MRVSQERTLEGRLLRISGAAERKPQAPNEMLQRVTERRLAEADCTVLSSFFVIIFLFCFYRVSAH